MFLPGGLRRLQLSRSWRGQSSLCSLEQHGRDDQDLRRLDVARIERPEKGTHKQGQFGTYNEQDLCGFRVGEGSEVRGMTEELLRFHEGMRLILVEARGNKTIMSDESQRRRTVVCEGQFSMGERDGGMFAQSLIGQAEAPGHGGEEI